MGAAEVVVFLQRHLRVEAHWRRLHHHKVTKDEVTSLHRLVGKSPGTTSQHVDATQLRPWLRGAPHLCEKKLRCVHWRYNVALRGTVRGVHEIVVFRCCSLSMSVLPSRDVVRQLHTNLTKTLRVVERHVPCISEPTSNDSCQTETLIVTETLLVHVPRWRDARLNQLRLNHEDVPHTLWVGGSAGRHDAKMKVLLLHYAFSLVGRQDLKQGLVRVDTDER
mmetsp:Transcript_1965/g.5559  ORF Transcript_1965/g.5559 Transcript_1965/m.5559 type:complete len:221 (-) Transcript_1965:588-1250(-)